MLSSAKINRLILFRKIIAIYCESNRKANKQSFENKLEFLNAKADGKHKKHSSLKCCRYVSLCYVLCIACSGFQ